MPAAATMVMRGDLVNGLCYTAFLPFYMWMWLRQPDTPGARNIVIAFCWTAACCWISYLTKSEIASMLACLGMSLSIAGMNLYRWPHSDEVVVLPQFLWSLLIVSGNALSFPVKTGMAFVALATALLVAVYSPLLQVADALPLLLGATAVFILFHYYADTRDELVSAHGASIVLAGTFAYHMSNEMLGIIYHPGYATEGGYSILKAGFFASVGLAAAGAFRREIDVKEALEVLVEERAREIVKQTEHLRMVGLALEASETAIAITDPIQRIVWFNTALKRLTGRSADRLQDQSLMDALKPSDLDANKLLLCFDENATASDEIVVCGAEIQAEVSPFSGVGDARFLVVLKDITAQRARERAEKAAEQEAMYAKAMSESMEMLSHDMRTPAQGIIGMTSMLLDDPLVPIGAKESLSVVMASSRLLLTLINNLLDVRKCDADMMDEFEIVPVPVAQTLRDAADFCSPIASTSDVALELDLDEAGDAFVQTDALRLQQVLINLLANAIKYTAPGSTVKISAMVLPLDQVETNIDQALASGHHQSAWDTVEKKDVNVVVVEVIDQGNGISEDAAVRLFGKFAQLKDRGPVANKIGGVDVGQPAGTGLGLNLCLKFVQRMKGNIWAVNNRDRGACFSFYLPLASPEVAALPRPRSRQTLAREDISTQRSQPAFAPNYRVLAVDDSIINLKVIGRMLKRVGVANVMTVDSGSKALTALEEEAFDLVLTDIQMPEMSGRELSEAIRDGDLLKKPIVVGLTGDREPIDSPYAESGIVHVLHKPVTPQQLQDFFQNDLDNLTPAAAPLGR